MKPIILIGLHNPLSDRPRDALWPYPAGSTGDRLLQLIQRVAPDFTPDDYLDAFERLNLWNFRELPEGPSRTNLLAAEGRRLYRRCTSEPRQVVLLGAQVWSAVMNRVPPSWFECQLAGGSTFYMLPHPCGLNRLYNRMMSRRRAGQLLLRLARPRVARRIAV